MNYITDDDLIQKAVDLGAFSAAVVKVDDIKSNPEFRIACEANR